MYRQSYDYYSTSESSTDVSEERVCVYTDGSCIRNGDARPAAGYGIWWGDYDKRNQWGPLNGNYPTSNQAELVAVKLAIEQAIDLGYSALAIYTDSEYVQNTFEDWIHTWKNNGWINSNGHHVKNQKLIREIDELMGEIDVEFYYVKAHADCYGNNRADILARKGAADHPNY